MVCQPRHRSEGNAGHLHPTGACLRVRTGRYEAFKSTGCRIGEVRQIVTREGGSLLVTTSRRTSREAADVIDEAAKESGGWREGLGDRLVRLGLLRYRRDFSLFHQQLIARNLAVRFGAPFSLFKAHPLTISPW